MEKYVIMGGDISMIKNRRLKTNGYTDYSIGSFRIICVKIIEEEENDVYFWALKKSNTNE